MLLTNLSISTEIRREHFHRETQATVPRRFREGRSLSLQHWAERTTRVRDYVLRWRQICRNRRYH
jgi:hypothetical protein